MKRSFGLPSVLLLVAACGGDPCPPEGFGDFFDGDILITLTRGDSTANDDYFDATVILNESLDTGPNGEERYLLSLATYCNLLLQRSGSAGMCDPTTPGGAVSLDIIEQRSCRWTTRDGARAEWTIDSSYIFWKKDELEVMATGPVTYTTTTGSTDSGTATYSFLGEYAF